METLLAKLLTGTNATLVGAVFALLQVLKMVVPKWASTKLGQRLMPVIPLVLAMAGALAGLCSGNTWQERLAIGIIAGFAAGQGFKVGKTTLLGNGIEVPPPKK